MNLPSLIASDTNGVLPDANRILITCEGFEDRSLSYLNNLNKRNSFSKIYIIHNLPERKNRLEELKTLAKFFSKYDPVVVDFPRFDPVPFEHAWHTKGPHLLKEVEEVIIDISVMSKLLICMLTQAFKEFPGKIRFIYCEPEDYSPSVVEYENHKSSWRAFSEAPSLGIFDILRVPSLSSSISQRRPILLTAFTSFNEQLVQALLTSVNPTKFLLINGIPPRFPWRELATQEIHSKILLEYAQDNQMNQDGLLIRRVSTLDYRDTINCLSKIYQDFSSEFRIVLAPTGSKLQALACGFVKSICPDIHFEYPTPESFNVTNYSSKNTHAIHELSLSVPEFLSDIRKIYKIPT